MSLIYCKLRIKKKIINTRADSKILSNFVGLFKRKHPRMFCCEKKLSIYIKINYLQQ